jgi:Zn-finger nucleic acid-binding protein
MGLTDSTVEPGRCPFCDADLASPGAGFVRHIDEAPKCRDAFETWRDRVTDDMRGGWPG